MPLDRDATLKKAEKLLRQGKLEGAIQEYVRLVEDQPRDWNAMNALGDLYARAGHADRAAAQFTRIADHLHDEGFFPKAAALYKKALKTRADHEPSLLRLGEIASRQGLVADARLYLNQLARLRRARGDERGANECLVALGALPDAGLKLAAGRAALALGDMAAAAELFLESSEIFDKEGRATEALEALVSTVQADGADARLRARVVVRCVEAGDPDRARQFLSRDTAGDHPDLLLALGSLELAAGRHDEARHVLSRLLVVAPHRAADVTRIAEELLRAGNADAAFDCIDAVTETALLGGDFDAAIHALQAFLRHGPHIPALIKLVEVAVDAGRDALVNEVQERLADAYLDAGRAAEARAIAEDLVTRDPRRGENVERLRQALTRAGAADVEAIVARHVEAANGSDDTIPELDLRDSPAAPAVDPIAAPHEPLEEVSVAVDITIDRPIEVSPLPGSADAGAAAPSGHEPGAGPEQGEFESVEIDLSDALSQLARETAVFAPPAPARAAVRDEPVPPPAARPAPPPDLETVFEQMRVRVREHQGTAPAARLERGLQLLEQGRTDEAVADLEAAARAPMLRFTAASALGRLYASVGEPAASVEWLERAVEAPAPSDADGLAVLYELAGALERVGEGARALAVLLEIDAAGASYRDVPARIEQLSRAQAGSRRL